MSISSKKQLEREAPPAVKVDVAADQMETEVKPDHQSGNVEDDMTVYGRWVDINTLSQANTFRNLFKRDPQVLARIRKSMQEYGFDQSYPIIAYRGVILDGNCRYEIAKELGHKNVFVNDYDENPESDGAKDHAILAQVARRNITDADILKFVERMDALKQKGRPSKLASTDANKGKSAAVIASKLNTSPSKVEKARKVLKSGDQKKIKDVMDGDTTLNRAAGELKADQGDADNPVYPKVLKALQQARKFSGNDQETKSEIESLIQKIKGKLSA